MPTTVTSTHTCHMQAAPWADRLPALQQLIASLTSPQGVHGKILQALLRNLIRLAYNLPGSASNQADHEGGFVTHSLDIALATAAAHKQQSPQADWQQLCTAFAAGLCHDLGSLLLYQISLANERFTAGTDYLQDRCTACAKDAQYELQQQGPGPARSWQDHRPLASYVLAMIVPPGILRRLRLRNANQLLWTLVRPLADAHQQTRTDSLRSLVNHVLALHHKPRSEAHTETAPPPPPSVGNRLADDFIACWRAHAQAQKLRHQGGDAVVLLSPTHTIVSCDNRQARTSAMQVMRHALEPALQKLPAAYKNLYTGQTGADGKIFLPDLCDRYAARGLVLHRDKDGTEHARLYIRYQALGERMVRGLWGVIISNDLLWGTTAIPTGWSLYRGGIAICDHHRQPSLIDAQSCGFNNLGDSSIAQPDTPAQTQPRELQRITPHASAQSPHHPSARRSAVAIWHALHEMRPLPEQSDSISERWHRLDAQLTPGDSLADDTDVDYLLAETAARLHDNHLQWDQESEQPVSLTMPKRRPHLAERAAQTPVSVSDLAQQLLLLAHHAQLLQAQGEPEHDIWHIVINKEHIGFRWPDGVAHLFSTDKEQQRRLLPSLDQALQTLAQHCGNSLIPGPGGSPLHYVQIDGIAYNTQTERRRHHRLLVLRANPDSTANRPTTPAQPAREHIIRCGWHSLAKTNEP